MNCRHSLNSLSAYLDRELTGDQMLAMRSHVDRCHECSAELDSLRELKSELSSLPMCSPRKELTEEILRKVRISEPATAERRWSWGLTVATSVAAAALALLAFNAFIGVSPNPQIAEDGDEFNAGSDHYVHSPGSSSTAPLIPVSK